MSNADTPLPTLQVQEYHHAVDIPDDVLETLYQREGSANVILPFLEKARAPNFPAELQEEQLWIVVRNGENVEFVLSCTHGQMGNYPIFIVTCASASQLGEDVLHGAMQLLAHRLLQLVDPKRVFSVFAVAPVAKVFAAVFQTEVGDDDIRAIEDARYDATLSCCTRETLVESVESSLRYKPKEGESEDVEIVLRRAVMETDLEEVAVLCEAFSKESPPYLLNEQQARLEAATMIANEQVWIHRIQFNDQAPEIACLVATTRVSAHVTTITKVITAEKWRKRGCANRLVHRVCDDPLRWDLLTSARNLYRSIGFQGLGDAAGVQQKGKQKQEEQLVENWLEIGFDGATLGYW